MKKLVCLPLMLILMCSFVFAEALPFNLSISNSTIVIQREGTFYSFSNAPANQSFTFNFDCEDNDDDLEDCEINYDRIKNLSSCNMNYNLTCPTPSCPAPSCPAANCDCPDIDLLPVKELISSEGLELEILMKKVNASIISSKNSGSSGIGGVSPTLILIIAFVLAGLAFLKREWIKEKFNKKSVDGEKKTKPESTDEPTE